MYFNNSRILILKSTVFLFFLIIEGYSILSINIKSEFARTFSHDYHFI